MWIKPSLWGRGRITINITTVCKLHLRKIMPAVLKMSQTRPLIFFLLFKILSENFPGSRKCWQRKYTVYFKNWNLIIEHLVITNLCLANIYSSLTVKYLVKSKLREKPRWFIFEIRSQRALVTQLLYAFFQQCTYPRSASPSTIC
jgi:hypothetical protein